MTDAELGRELLKGVAPSLDLGVSLLVSAVIAVLVYGQIAKRAGFSRWLGLVMCVPVLGVLAPVVFACVRWPVERRTVASRRKRRRR